MENVYIKSSSHILLLFFFSTCKKKFQQIDFFLNLRFSSESFCKDDGKKRFEKQIMSSSVSCAQHHQHQQLSFRGRVGKTSSSASSCSTSFSSRGGGRKATLKCFAGGGAISKPWDIQKPCKLVLEDGSVWQGKAFGAEGTKVGEVVFNTSLSGYVYFSLL